MLNVVELFAGIGAFTQGLKNLKVDHMVRLMCEVDKAAAAAYMVNHEIEDYHDDVTKLVTLPACDILMACRSY